MANELGQDRIINLNEKKTESGWARAAQGFFEKFTPLWFSWIGWIFATGASAYLAKETGSVPMGLVVAISYSLLFMYFVYFFGSIRIEPYFSWADRRPSKWRRFLARLPIYATALIIVFGISNLIDHIIAQIQITP